MGKIKKKLNGHNFGCIQDRFLIFGSKVWFSVTANSTGLFKFTSDRPLLPWQRNLSQNSACYCCFHLCYCRSPVARCQHACNCWLSAGANAHFRRVRRFLSVSDIHPCSVEDYILLKATLVLPVTQSNVSVNWTWCEVNSAFYPCWVGKLSTSLSACL